MRRNSSWCFSSSSVKRTSASKATWSPSQWSRRHLQHLRADEALDEPEDVGVRAALDLAHQTLLRRASGTAARRPSTARRAGTCGCEVEPAAADDVAVDVPAHALGHLDALRIGIPAGAGTVDDGWLAWCVLLGGWVLRTGVPSLRACRSGGGAEAAHEARDDIAEAASGVQRQSARTSIDRGDRSAWITTAPAFVMLQVLRRPSGRSRGGPRAASARRGRDGRRSVRPRRARVRAMAAPAGSADEAADRVPCVHVGLLRSSASSAAHV